MNGGYQDGVQMLRRDIPARREAGELFPLLGWGRCRFLFGLSPRNGRSGIHHFFPVGKKWWS
jgi:hypothetical protein